MHNVEWLTLISLFHCFGIGILQVLEQLSGQTPVFSKGELDVKVCIWFWQSLIVHMTVTVIQAAPQF